ncbi:hypothetical protein BDQ17DRAFT_1358344 [Cyathus striatus]|nr:hypothetical protein BDQ17DRAFT_1358344 [Cyathus striatus]
MATSLLEILFATVYIISFVMCFAVGACASNGDTVVEVLDFKVYRNRAKVRDEVLFFSFQASRKGTFSCSLT